MRGGRDEGAWHGVGVGQLALEEVAGEGRGDEFGVGDGGLGRARRLAGFMRSGERGGTGGEVLAGVAVRAGLGIKRGRGEDLCEMG